MLTCKNHPRYLGIHKPRASKNYPNGCPDCIKLFNFKSSQIINVIAYCGACDKNVPLDDFGAYGEPQAGSTIYGTCPECLLHIESSFF